MATTQYVDCLTIYSVFIVVTNSFFVISRLKPSLVSRHVNRMPDVRVLTGGA